MFPNLLRTYGVSHVVSPLPGRAAGLTLVSERPGVYVYRVEQSARVRFVSGARVMESTGAHS